MAENFPGETPDPARDARQLELVDRIIGLQAEVAHLRSSASSAQSLQQLAEIHSSATWRIGRMVIAPIAAVRRLTRGRRS
jgi:predicted ATP-grasp superfamily ATP-dependent carboligase